MRQIHEELGIDPFLAQMLLNRGLQRFEEMEEFLYGDHDALHDPGELDGIAEAAELACQAVREGRKILVHGDYDADGVSGTAVLVSFLRDIGASAIPYIPHRIDEGYGLSPEAVKHATDHDASLMISVDCGSSSPSVVDQAHAAGLQVIVTDHHMVTTPPPADVFVNPRAPASDYPFPLLSGAGVAYKLVQAMAACLGCGNPEDYLDLAAIGTVGDVVPLVRENRIIVREGLAVMQRLQRPGIAALARVAGLLDGGARDRGRGLSARDVAFEIAPRINACGRLEHAMTALELLLETDTDRAESLAREVDALNLKRREMEMEMRHAAEARALERGLDGWNVIVEASEGWHQGVVGITASRLLDRFGLPSFVISIDGETGQAKGSARAPAHIDLYACLQRCADLFTHFGGHPRAAGFSMPAENIDALRERLQHLVPELAGPPQPRLAVDLDLPLAKVERALVEALEPLEPTGHANPAPLFLARGVLVRFPEKVKDRHWRFQAQQGSASARCIAFNMVERLPDLCEGDAYDMIYELEDEVFRGEPRISFKVRELVPSTVSAPRSVRPRRERDEPTLPLSEAVPGVEATESTAGVEVPVVEAPAPTSRQRTPAVEAPLESAATPAVTAPLGAEPVFIAPPRDSWQIEDARGHHNFGRYVADVVDEGFPTVVLCRRDQTALVAKAVAGDAPRPPASLRVVPYLDEAPTLSGIQYVLFAPPPSLEALAPLRRAGGGRCHVAFRPADLDEQAALVRAVSMPIERLRLIYRLFRRGVDADGLLQRAAFSDLLRGEQGDLVPRSLEVAARIFVEAAALEAVPGQPGTYRFTDAKPDFQASATWLRYRDLHETFAAVADLFSRDAAGMREGLRLILTGGA